MKRFSARQRLLIGALVLAGGVWVADTLTRGGPPPVQAAPNGPSASGTIAEWCEVERMVARLTQQEYESVAPAVGTLERDLFVPTEAVGQILAAPEPENAGQPESAPAEVEEDFRSRHKLAGVVLGQVPLAVIDGRIFPLYTELDGYRLVEVHRDQVVFQQVAGSSRVILELDAPGVDK